MVARRKRRKPTPYPSDLTDAQWELIAPRVPAALPGGRPAIHDRRRIVEAILYVNRTGCSWRQLPHDFPPWQTVFGYFQRWNESGLTDRIHDALRAKLRDRSGRDPMASAGMVDAQAVKGADTVGTDTRGWDGGKRVNGRKRHVVTDLLGLLVVVLVTAASVQDRDGGHLALSRAKTVMPSMVLVWADGGYAGRLVAWVAEHCRMMLDIVRKLKGKQGFSVLPHHWPIERTLAWIVRCRRLDHDYGRLPAHSEAMIKWAMIGLMARRLAPPHADDAPVSRPARRDTFRTLSQAEKDGANKYSGAVLAAYDTFVLKWSNTYAWRCPRERLLIHYNTHLGGRHLDIGPGTGWYLYQATYPTAAPHITLLDLNAHTMAMTSGRLADRNITPEVHTGSILAPLDPAVGVFDSVAANFVFHCVPGTWAQKGAAFGNIAQVVADDGVFFGSTILGTGVAHNLFGRALCALYNGPIRSFDNRADDLDGLRTALSAAFGTVDITVVGTVAVFAAHRPRRTPTP